MRSSPVDRLFQLAYRGAYLLMRANWALRRPFTHGALVAIWYEGRVLLIRNSYVDYYSLPGGYVRARETGEEAATRELREELSLSVARADLKLALVEDHEWEGKRERVEIFEYLAEDALHVEPDNREVIEAAFFPPERALTLALFPPARTVIRRRLERLHSA